MFAEVIKLVSQIDRIRPGPALHRDLPNLFRTLQTARKTDALDAENRIWVRWEWHTSLQAANSLNVATGHLAAREYAEAETRLTALVHAYPDFAEAWNKRATLFYLLKRDTESIDDIARTLKLEPRHFGALAGLGQILARHGRGDLAEITFAAALRLNPHLEGMAAALASLRSEARGGLLH